MRMQGRCRGDQRVCLQGGALLPPSCQSRGPPKAAARLDTSSRRAKEGTRAGAQGGHSSSLHLRPAGLWWLPW